MPKMDGFEATRKIRVYERDNNIPPVRIIALTASALDQSKQECIEAGMDGFISKPFQEVDLLNTIHPWGRSRMALT